MENPKLKLWQGKWCEEQSSVLCWAELLERCADSNMMQCSGHSCLFDWANRSYQMGFASTARSEHTWPLNILQRRTIISSPVQDSDQIQRSLKYPSMLSNASRSIIIRVLVVFSYSKGDDVYEYVFEKLFTWLKLCHHSEPAGFTSSEDIQGHAVECCFRLWNIPPHIWGSSRRWKGWQNSLISATVKICVLMNLFLLLPSFCP